MDNKCDIEICDFNESGLCVDITTKKDCPFKSESVALIEKVYSKYPEDKDICVLLQECIRLCDVSIRVDELTKEVERLSDAMKTIGIRSEN